MVFSATSKSDLRPIMLRGRTGSEQACGNRLTRRAFFGALAVVGCAPRQPTTPASYLTGASWHGEGNTRPLRSFSAVFNFYGVPDAADAQRRFEALLTEASR